MPDIFDCSIVFKERLADSVYAITVSSPDITNAARAGQFVNIKCGEGSLLRRPLSICSIDDDELRFVFEVKGEGTRWLSGRVPGQSIDIFGPLGNGFNIPRGNIVVVGGGIGSPPMLFVAESSEGDVTAVLGFRDSRKIILKTEFESACNQVFFTTDDGSFGTQGTVAQPLQELLESGGFDAVLACGPRPMLSAVADICKQRGVPCQVSLEERMGCGVGACVVCACLTVIDGAEGVSRVCRDGPVFYAEDIRWQLRVEI